MVSTVHPTSNPLANITAHCKPSLFTTAWEFIAGVQCSPSLVNHLSTRESLPCAYKLSVIFVSLFSKKQSQIVVRQ